MNRKQKRKKGENSISRPVQLQPGPKPFSSSLSFTLLTPTPWSHGSRRTPPTTRPPSHLRSTTATLQCYGRISTLPCPRGSNPISVSPTPSSSPNSAEPPWAHLRELARPPHLPALDAVSCRLFIVVFIAQLKESSWDAIKRRHRRRLPATVDVLLR